VPEITVGLPAAMTAPEPARDVACDAATVVEALREVVAQSPRYQHRLFYGDRLLVGVCINGRHVPAAEAKHAALVAGDRVDVLPPVAGG
jgi:molybdopterin converting factor small subunit